jgi:hypothetical protein
VFAFLTRIAWLAALSIQPCKSLCAHLLRYRGKIKMDKLKHNSTGDAELDLINLREKYHKWKRVCALAEKLACSIASKEPSFIYEFSPGIRSDINKMAAIQLFALEFVDSLDLMRPDECLPEHLTSEVER